MYKAFGGTSNDHGWDWYASSNIRLYGDFWGYFGYNLLSENDCLHRDPRVLNTYPDGFVPYASRARLMWPAKTEDECTNNYDPSHGCEILSPKNQAPGTTVWIQRYPPPSPHSNS